MQRFYQPPEAFAGNYINSADKKFINQLSKVLRAKEGDRFGIFDNSGYEYTAQLISLETDIAKFLIIDKKQSEREWEKEIIIYPSLLKSDKFEWMLQKVAELGVRKIVPVVSGRCVVKEISPAKMTRYRDIIKEATEQCGGCIVPILEDSLVFESAVLNAADEDGLKAIAWEKEKDIRIMSELKSADKAHIFIGPEGGYENGEIEFAREHKIKSFGLGRRILRAETASVFAVSQSLSL